MTEKSKINVAKIVFYAAMTMGLLYLIGYGIITKNAMYENIVFGRAGSSFSDFWSCVKDNIGMNPYYDANSSYPPLVNLFFAFIAKLVPVTDDIMNGTASIMTPLNQIIFIVYNIIIINLMIAFISYYKKGKVFEKTIFSLIMLLSAPFLFMFERGNIISLALIMLFAFVNGKDSENKWVREIAYLCLGCSAAIKIYPAVFGLLLIKDRNYKAAARATVYGILLFVLPFFVYGGIPDLFLMFNNISTAAEVFRNTNGVCGKINMVPTITVILGLFGVDQLNNGLEKILSVLPYIYLLLAIVACIFHKSNWKVMTLLVSMIVLIPDFSFEYTLIFFVIPIICFLDSKEKRTWIHWVSLLCYISIIIPIPNDLPEVFLKFQTSFRYVFSLLIQGSAVLIISLLLTAEGLVFACKEIKKYFESKFLVDSLS